jgi:hypothetical protein
MAWDKYYHVKKKVHANFSETISELQRKFQGCCFWRWGSDSDKINQRLQNSHIDACTDVETVEACGVFVFPTSSGIQGKEPVSCRPTVDLGSPKPAKADP